MASLANPYTIDRFADGWFSRCQRDLCGVRDRYQPVEVSVQIDVDGIDFGDAWISDDGDSGISGVYPVSLADDGARHRIGDLFLGESVDDELDATTTDRNEGGDNQDGVDEDGVTLLASVFSLGTESASSLEIVSSGTGVLEAWIDWNRDGQWDDLDEHVISSIGVSEGAQIISFGVPAGASPGLTAMRVRLSSSSELGPLGFADDGEVEDYVVEVLSVGEPIALTSTGPSVTTVHDVDDRLEYRRGNDLVASYPKSLLNVWAIEPSETDDELMVGREGEGELAIAGDGGDGRDGFVIDGARRRIDLDQLAPESLKNIEFIDIRGSGPNQLRFSPDSVEQITDGNNRFEIMYDSDDTVDLGEGWIPMPPERVDGTIVHRLHRENANLTITNDTPATNPVDPFDVDRSGAASPVDALSVIN